MHHVFARIPAHFYRISLISDKDNMTLALVPEQEHANLIAKLLEAHYGLRKGERIVVTPSIIRPADAPEVSHVEVALHDVPRPQ